MVLLFLQETYISLTNQIQGPCLKLWIKVFSVGYMVESVKKHLTIFQRLGVALALQACVIFIKIIVFVSEVSDNLLGFS